MHVILGHVRGFNSLLIESCRWVQLLNMTYILVNTVAKANYTYSYLMPSYPAILVDTIIIIGSKISSSDE